jgi:UDP-N-acetylglucosamine 2-epimerase (non-hydrolysing)
LKHAGVHDSSIFFVGNTMIDTLLANIEKLKKPGFWDTFNLKENEYFVLTMHRPSNVDEKTILAENLHTILEGANGLLSFFQFIPE